MTVETDKRGSDVGKPVVEQRLKPTLIRRRASKEEPRPEEPIAEEVAAATEAGGTEKSPTTASTEASQQKTGDAAGATPPATVEKRIGVVGHIDVLMPKVREGWKERQQQRQPRRKRSREEIEMETIRRAGGLKHYAEIAAGDVVEGQEVSQPEASVPEFTAPALGERIFQPKSTGRRRKTTRREFKKTQVTEPRAIKKIIRVEGGMTVSGLSQATGTKTGEIIKRLMDLEIMTTANQSLSVDIVTMIAEEYGYTVEHTAFKEEDVLAVSEAHASAEHLTSRSPVVTVMGHVDHGKTSLLDVIRKANVTAGEAGGITQHIGAYEVFHPKGSITFLDTPGHEAFTNMRARGAEATDIVVLVVAADDGIMPQTIEAIDHAKAAGVPIIVAVNKIDKPNAQPDRVKQSLTEHGLVPEEWGGDVICVPTSAKTKEGIDKLLEMILLQAEVLELTADATIRPKGVVIEARLDRGRGPVVTVLVQEGVLRVGHYIVCGTHYGKVRAMQDADGRPVKEAGPSKPVEIQGLGGVPEAGDEMVGVADEQGARLVAEGRQQRRREGELIKSARTSLEDLHQQIESGEVKELTLVIKADVHGSIEAVADALVKLSTDAVKVAILHRGVGGITENDVMLAAASQAVIIGFNVQPDGKAREAAEREKVEIRSYRIIYEMIDQVKKAMEGLLSPEEIERVLGLADVREVFRISKVGQIAGCSVTSGKITRGARARLLRDQVIVIDGKISSLKRFKDDAREVTEGYECGIGLENFNDIKVGDVVQAYVIEKKAATL